MVPPGAGSAGAFAPASMRTGRNGANPGAGESTRPDVSTRSDTTMATGTRSVTVTITVSGHDRRTRAVAIHGSRSMAAAARVRDRVIMSGWVVRPAARRMSAGAVWTSPVTRGRRTASNGECKTASARRAATTAITAARRTRRRRRLCSARTSRRRCSMRGSTSGGAGGGSTTVTSGSRADVRFPTLSTALSTALSRVARHHPVPERRRVRTACSGIAVRVGTGKADQADLGAELDAGAGAHRVAHAGDDRVDVVGGPALVGLHEVGVLGRHRRRAHPEALQAGLVDQAPGRVAWGVGEDGARVLPPGLVDAPPAHDVVDERLGFPAVAGA